MNNPLQELSDLLEADIVPVTVIIPRAIAIAMVPGTVSVLRTAADDLDTISRNYENEQTYSTQNLTHSLPQIWFGTTAVAATDASAALGATLREAKQTFLLAHDSMNTFADALAAAQAQDDTGQITLFEAKQAAALIPNLTDPANEAAEHRIRALTRNGLHDRLAGQHAAYVAARAAAVAFRLMAGAAYRARLVNDKSTPLEALAVTSATGVPLMDGTNLPLQWDFAPGYSMYDDDLILSADSAGRAAVRLDAMSPADRAAFDRLLAGSKSPQERAYLMQSLAAGHSLADLRAFDGLVHPHGDDQVWLKRHLLLAEDSEDPTSGFPHYSPYTQLQLDETADNEVSNTIMMGRSRLDPFYALQLSTGQTIADGKVQGRADDAYVSDSARARAESARIRAEGLKVEGHDATSLTPSGIEAMGRDELGASGNTDYHVVTFDSADARRDALVTIGKSVDGGTPVPVGVDADGGTHEVLIVGHAGDQLEIYDASYGLTWVDAQTFVDGGFGLSLHPNTPPIPATALLPGK